MSKQTFKDFKNHCATAWAEDDVNNFDAKEFVIDVLKDYYLLELPNNKKDFFNYLVHEKGYEEYDAKELLEWSDDE